VNFARLVATVLMALILGSNAALLPVSHAAGAVPASSDEDTLQRQTIDPDDLATYVDALFAEHMEEYGIPGAAFAMVSGQEILLTRSYGLANQDAQIPVDAQTTLFDIGSVTKLFTATAAMQVAEQGLIDLDTDVNEYITGFQVPDTYAEPVTMRHLLTHTAGFEDRFFLGMVAPSDDERQPLGENLAEHLPPRVRPPGEVFDYNNFGTTLAGHVVESVSGQPFEEYVSEHILQPLGMTRSGFTIPPEYQGDMALAYGGFTSEVEELEPWPLNHLPAGGLRTTAVEASAFMLAHLNGGEYQGNRILDADSVDEMHTVQFRPHPAVSGIGLGFSEHQVEDRRGIQHAGDWVGTAAILYLLPDEQVGIFAAYNSGAGALARTKLVEALLEQYFPVAVFNGEPAADATDRMPMFAGNYRLLRQDRHTFLRLPSMLFNVSMEVRAEPDGTLMTVMSRSPLFPEALVPDTRWVETEPGVFREVNGTSTMAFDLDNDGNPGRLHIYWPQGFTMDRVAWYQSTTFHVGTLLLLVVIMLVAAIGWPATALYRRLRHRGSQPSAALRAARHLGGMASLIILVFLVAFLLFFAIDTVGLLQAPPLLTALLILPFAAVILTMLLVYAVARLWFSSEGTIPGRIYHTVITMALLAFIPVLYYWGLLGFNY
jgi:CubicO group peptidase (beta-lactamase class C family)